MQEMYKKTGGFIKGICHPSEDISLITNSGIEWVRMDVPWPNTAEYTAFISRIANFHTHGIRPILISPYPSEFLKHGIDPIADPNGVESLCARIAADFSSYRPVWQATNEMHMAHFRVPLTEIQAVDFLISSIRGLRRGDPNAAVGHNTVDDKWIDKARLVHDSVKADYIGLDLYAGTWAPGDDDTYIKAIDRLYDVLKLPVVLMEFGFASLGGSIEPDYSDVLALINSWGFRDLADAEANLDIWISKLPPRLRDIALSAAPEERLNTISQEFFLHILKKWPCPSFLPHTDEGQAEFYRRLLPRLIAHPHLAGAVIYCMSDSPRCFLCGESDCPLETAWGIVRMDGSLKPAYHAVSRCFR